MTKRPGRLLVTIRTLALGAFVGLSVGVAITAMSAFGFLDTLEGVTVNDDALSAAEGATGTAMNYGVADGDASKDLASKWIAGGVVGRTIRIALAVQLGLGVLALGMMLVESTPKFGGMLGALPKSPANLARIALLVAAIAMTGYMRFGLLPAMQELRPQVYAIAPDLPDKGAARRAEAYTKFDLMHRRSNQLVSLAAACVMLAGIASPYAFAPVAGGPGKYDNDPARPRKGPELDSAAFSKPEGSA
ncbi:MAG: hypothetical protein AAGA57_11480 [Planctomycetota bacterium]